MKWYILSYDKLKENFLCTWQQSIYCHSFCLPRHTCGVAHLYYLFFVQQVVYLYIIEQTIGL